RNVTGVQTCALPILHIIVVKVQEFKIWIKANRNKPLKEIISTVSRKLIGHYNYYGITDNSESLSRFLFEITKLLFKWLNRRSQKIGRASCRERVRTE